MKTRFYRAVIVGIAFGLVILWGAIGGGGLIGLTIATGTLTEEETQAARATPHELPKAA